MKNIHKSMAIFTFLISFCLIFSILAIKNNEMMNFYSNNLNANKKPQKSAIFIYLESNSQVASYCAGRGTGTPSDPYRIENLEIDGGSSFCIYLANISVYLKIQKCTLTRGMYSIYLRNVNNCLIYDNIMTGFNSFGILNDAEYPCYNDNITQNFIEGGANTPLYLTNITCAKISQNRIQNSNGMGMMIQECHNSSILNNTLINNAQYGIYIFRMNNSIIFGNMISKQQVGISLMYSNNSLVYMNSVLNSSHSQAYDMISVGNTWDNGTDGNYWSDYSLRYPVAGQSGKYWTTSYQINYSSPYVDNFPLIDPPSNDAPYLTAPADIEYTIGDTGKSIAWIAMDAIISNPTYTISKNGSSLVGSTAWSSGSPITLSVDGLAVGTYSYSIIINDGSGLTTSDEVVVKVMEKAATKNTTSNDTSKDADKKGIDGPTNVWVCGFTILTIMAIIQKRKMRNIKKI